MPWAKNKAAVKPTTKRVIIHPVITLISNAKLTPDLPSNAPTPTVAPTYTHTLKLTSSHSLFSTLTIYLTVCCRKWNTISRA